MSFVRKPEGSVSIGDLFIFSGENGVNKFYIFPGLQPEPHFATQFAKVYDVDRDNDTNKTTLRCEIVGTDEAFSITFNNTDPVAVAESEHLPSCITCKQTWPCQHTRIGSASDQYVVEVASVCAHCGQRIDSNRYIDVNLNGESLRYHADHRSGANGVPCQTAAFERTVGPITRPCASMGT